MATGAVLCKQELKKLLRNDRNYYSTPELNDVLFLHFKGYRKLEALEEFTGLRTLHAETNGKNPCLRTLQLEKNYIGRNGRHDFDNLASLKALTVLDLSNNQIEDPAIVFEVLTQLPHLKVLYLKGNPVSFAFEAFMKLIEDAQLQRREMLDMRAEDREDDDLHNHLENVERNRETQTLPDLEAPSFPLNTPATDTPTTDQSPLVPSLAESLPDESGSIATSQGNAGEDVSSDCEHQKGKEESDDVGSIPNTDQLPNCSELEGPHPSEADDGDTPRERNALRNEVNFDALD
ncbi:putative leucine rich repeat protein [Neospora caninum Liverpool]|uniref:Putative leucine rich repeat protein n=1 Tax=Neospora caninum (strain Liverpool) TaxID=572307 RepID=F0VIK4_NEOCL|nr:putative leucine rich repeat protein [Neospora caninum Liverpool]CBZ53565.1 putative leucine rich repeat protein [Neospora caninum Liverpool]|eukprot:XP_003883597.1 putative leucine rich repeat protein [Neospora caninum Liverpool]